MGVFQYSNLMMTQDVELTKVHLVSHRGQSDDVTQDVELTKVHLASHTFVHIWVGFLNFFTHFFSPI